MKCDNCTHLICDPPCMDDPYGCYACGIGHWDGMGEQSEGEPEPNTDPWKFCKDFKENA